MTYLITSSASDLLRDNGQIQIYIERNPATLAKISGDVSAVWVVHLLLCSTVMTTTRRVQTKNSLLLYNRADCEEASEDTVAQDLRLCLLARGHRQHLFIYLLAARFQLGALPRRHLHEHVDMVGKALKGNRISRHLDYGDKGKSLWHTQARREQGHLRACRRQRGQKLRLPPRGIDYEQTLAPDVLAVVVDVLNRPGTAFNYRPQRFLLDGG